MKNVMKAVAALMLLMVIAVGCNKEIIYDGHEYVDLGLPSGTLWATCNVGADTPEGRGSFFAWGETQPKETFRMDNYKYWVDYYYLTKYCHVSYAGYNGYKDDLTVLQQEDDAATTNWGNDARTPTREEWQELLDNCNSRWTKKNHVSGMLFMGLNGKTLFIPEVGCSYIGSDCYYWSSSLYTDHFPTQAWHVWFNHSTNETKLRHESRDIGMPIRPVRSAQ